MCIVATVGKSTYSRGLLLLVETEGIPTGKQSNLWGNVGGFLFVRLHLSAHKCDSCLPSLSLYFNIYFASTDATMFQNIEQFHSGGSNTNSFRLLVTLFRTKNSIDMRILSTELSQLKRIAIINPLAIVFVKLFLSVLYLEI